MALKIRLYPPVQVTGKSFEGVKSRTVPNQSMSLREIVRRFVRRESLPISQNGIYEERFGDLEKLEKADITEKMDRVEELKLQIAAFNKRQKEREAAAAAKVAASNPPATPITVPPVGGTPINSPPPQGA